MDGQADGQMGRREKEADGRAGGRTEEQMD